MSGIIGKTQEDMDSRMADLTKILSSIKKIQENIEFGRNGVNINRIDYIFIIWLLIFKVYFFFLVDPDKTKDLHHARKLKSKYGENKK
jgi:hypothetical protein